MNTRGRPIRGLIGGFLLGLCVDLDLAFSGAVKLNSVVLTIMPVALLVVGLVLGLWAPIGRSKGTERRSIGPLPPPVAWPDSAPTEGSAATTPPPPPAEPPAQPLGEQPPTA